MNFRNTIYIAALLAALLLPSCSKESAPDRGEELNVLLQMSVGTKAVDETDGALDEAEAKINSLRVFAFVDGEAAGHFYTADASSLANTDGSGMNFLMDIKMYSLGSREVDFYVVANEASMLENNAPVSVLSESTTEAQLARLSFTGIQPAAGLPMYFKGSRTIDFSSDAADNPQTQPGHEGHILLADKLEFELSRPMGKIGVFAAKPEGEDGTLRVTGLSVTRSRFVNFLMPPADLEAAYGSVGSAAVRELAVVEGEVTATVASGDTDASHYTPVQAEVYYPFENPWGSDAWNMPGDSRGNILTIEYQYDGDAQPRSGTVYLPPIERNHYYMVCCQLSNSGKIIVNYTVSDWDDSEPYELEFAAPQYEYPTQVYPAAAAPYPAPEVYYNGDRNSPEGTFSVNFRISGPVGQIWQPTLLNATEADYEITVMQNNSPVTAPYEASADPYTITIRPLRQDNVGKTLEFAISYTPQWDPAGTSLLLINNGSWPSPEGTVNPEHKIVIKQIEP